MVPVIFVPEVLVVAPGQLMVPIIAELSTERHDELTCHVPTTSPPHALAVPQPPPESLSEPPHAVRYKALKPMSPTNKFLMRSMLAQRVRALECKIVHSAARSSLLLCSACAASARFQLPMFGFICPCSASSAYVHLPVSGLHLPISRALFSNVACARIDAPRIAPLDERARGRTRPSLTSSEQLCCVRLVPATWRGDWQSSAAWRSLHSRTERWAWSGRSE